MQKPALLLAVALLLCLGQHELSAGYTQKLVVQVFDQNLRPVDGALVYVDQQINSVAGYGKTKPVPTSVDGTVSLSFTDWEELEGQTLYTYTLYVKYGGQVQSATLIADPSQTRTYSMQVSAYYAFVSVHDQTGRPLSASVTIGNTTEQTDIGGKITFQLPPADYNVRTEINGVVKNSDLNLAKDEALDVEFPLYSVRVSVTDDFKRPLAAQVSLDGKTGNTSTDGMAMFFNVSDEQPKIAVVYNSSIKKLQPDLKNGGDFTVVFDLTAPIIQETHSSVQQDGTTLVDAYVLEPGAAASGISGVSISYSVGGVSTAVPTYTIGYDSFEARIPVVPKDTPVTYTVKATDREGNVATATGTYAIPSEKKQPVAPKAGAGAFGTGLDWGAVGAGVLVLAIVAYAALYYRGKKKHEKELQEEMELEPSSKAPPAQSPPPAPPQA